jgi:hypothetical protein
MNRLFDDLRLNNEFDDLFDMFSQNAPDRRQDVISNRLENTQTDPHVSDFERPAIIYRGDPSRNNRRHPHMQNNRRIIQALPTIDEDDSYSDLATIPEEELLFTDIGF